MSAVVWYGPAGGHIRFKQLSLDRAAAIVLNAMTSPMQNPHLSAKRSFMIR